MGNGLSFSPSCLHLPAAAAPTAVRLVYWGGLSRQLVITGGGGDDDVVTAGDVAAELPAPAAGYAVCPADAFFVGLPIPAMSPGEELLPGRTYFVLPAARLPCLKALTPATLAALSYGDGGSNGNGNGNGKRKQPLFAVSGPCPFEHVKGADGAAPLIRVLPEFIEKLITCDAAGGRGANSKAKDKDAELCSTPELKRHYAQLVGTGRSRPWSPRLETISERNRSRWMTAAARTMLSSR
ncbi:hypothetical protein BDA96_03G461100 [Sorghum bicolor]|uniref:DUF4228 domain-containing protein n=1 Tax=Sorghum bicolor TaxID=4558 RepID=A0A921RIP9_SORBI|nr:hypothetical protein BDA96_03G461100 [Sorghum bicolor]